MQTASPWCPWTETPNAASETLDVSFVTDYTMKPHTHGNTLFPLGSAKGIETNKRQREIDRVREREHTHTHSGSAATSNIAAVEDRATKYEDAASKSDV